MSKIRISVLLERFSALYLYVSPVLGLVYVKDLVRSYLLKTKGGVWLKFEPRRGHVAEIRLIPCVGWNLKL